MVREELSFTSESYQKIKRFIDGNAHATCDLHVARSKSEIFRVTLSFSNESGIRETIAVVDCDRDGMKYLFGVTPSR